MTYNFDSREEIKKIDPEGVYEGTLLFPDQCEQAWSEASKIEFPAEYKNIKNVVVCGMGGSRFTPLSIKHAFADRISVPYEIVDEYELPSYVNEETLVVLSSYSGTTEEVVSCAEDALKKGAKVTGVTRNGKVGEILKRDNLSGYIFEEKFNPSGQPRIGGGYMLMGHLGILSSLGFVKVEESEVSEAISFARVMGEKFLAEVSEDKNDAKKLARQLLDKDLFIITAEHLKGFANGFANQTNETAKMISSYRYISELNHHLMEGLKHPETLGKNGLFLFFESELYSPSIQKRFPITKEVVEKQGIETLSMKLEGKTRLAQLLEAFTISSFTTLYMAILYGTNPVEIPWVDYFKEQLSK